ncbi:ankyrin repeat-containing protein-like [Dorcoceras hygrometricum]|uniref:Ankyrin repeat-containing protein-like n=1 Tax=Dorcoceras hygrometricum TaxID=472368 RepID=A0A2Z7BZT5_9LAMI|nr:ankyrin repeat-containing protein-like [Dorcoceras hygrometricum]
MSPRRGSGRTVRRSAEESRASVTEEGVQQVEDVTRQIGGMELVLAIFRPKPGRVFQPALDVSHSFQSPQGSQQSNRQRYSPRGKQFKKRSNSSSSASRGLSPSSLCDVVSVSTPAGVSLLTQEVVIDGMVSVMPEIIYVVIKEIGNSGR